MSRTPGYERQTVVAQAMTVFWDRGYSKTSVGDLVRATGLKPGSLYAAFGSKKGVFLEVLDEYNRNFLATISQLGGSDRSTIDDLEALLEDIVDATASGRDRRGCLSVNALTEMAQHDEEIAARIATHNARVERAFAEVLGRAQSDGDIAMRKDTEAMAAFLVNNLWGMRVMCKGTPDRRALEAVVDGVMTSLRAN